MGVTVVKPLSVEEYLSDPAYERFEYIDGQPVELNVGSLRHGRIQGKCFRKFDEYFETHKNGFAVSEARCRLKVRGDQRFYLPDVVAILGPPSDDRFLDRAPELAVEIRSPDDSITRLQRKLADYLANGAKMAWLIVPEERSVIVQMPGAEPKILFAGDTLDGGEVLPGLEFPVDDLFA